MSNSAVYSGMYKSTTHCQYGTVLTITVGIFDPRLVLPECRIVISGLCWGCGCDCVLCWRVSLWS